MSSDLNQTIKELLVERLFLKIEASSIEDQLPLIDHYGIDSVQLLEMVVGVEEAFDISLEDEDFDVSRFSTVQAIADYVKEKQSK